MAYALVPVDEATYVAVKLVKVKFEDCAPADDGGILESAPFRGEFAPQAIRRLLRALKRRTRLRGWFSGYAQARGK